MRNRFIILGLLLMLGLAPPPNVGGTLDTKGELLQKRWSAYWIRCPNAPRREFGVYFFRKTITLTQVPGHFVVRASADNRYELFVNGVRVLSGPARGDLAHWRFETLDIAPFLRSGRNTLAAVVWNFAELAAMAQITNEAGFLLHGDGTGESIADTNASWKVLQSTAFQLIPPDCNLFVTIYPCAFPDPDHPSAKGPRHRSYFYHAVGPGERVDAALYPWGWQTADYDDSTWVHAVPIIYGGPREIWDTHSRWMLVPRNIPLMEEKLQRLVRVRRYTGPSAVQPSESFLEGHSPLDIPAHSRVSLLLDQTYETTAYPELVTSGGRGSQVTLTYAETLFDDRHDKGNRDVIEGKHIEGYTDQFLPDGGAGRLFRPLEWRAFRYIQLDVETADEPLVLKDFRGEFTAYPFELRARFETDDPTLEKIWQVGWRTVRLCSHETYMDCPYYEQLQYVEDTRIQALISLYLAGDDRLMKNAIECLDESRTAEGLTQARYPSFLPQYILPFSLYWIGMMHDLWWYRGEPEFLRPYLTNMRGVLSWFESRLTGSGMLPARLPWGPGSALLDLQLAAALQQAAEMESAFGSVAEAAHDRALASRINRAVYRACWNPARGLFADEPDGQKSSQDLNLIGVLTDAIPVADQRKVMRAVLDDQTLAQTSLDFRFYLFRAMKKAGLGDEYLTQLGPWRHMLSLGLTTFAEFPDPTRSDCHGWSAHPDFDLLATVAGIEPASAGFGSVAIRPHLGPLEWLKATLPLPAGNINVEYRRQRKGLEADVTLPSGITGWFYWQGERRALHSGAQHLRWYVRDPENSCGVFSNPEPHPSAGGNIP